MTSNDGVQFNWFIWSCKLAGYSLVQLITKVHQPQIHFKINQVINLFYLNTTDIALMTFGRCRGQGGSLSQRL